MIKKEISIALNCDCPECRNECNYGSVVGRFYGKTYNECIKEASKYWIFWKCENGKIKTFSKDCLDIGDE